MILTIVIRCQTLWATRERGATAVEYGLLLGLIGAAMITAVTLLGTRFGTMFTGTADKVQSP